MTEEERLNHAYLGDGVYAESTPEHIILRTGDHRDDKCDNKVYLEQDVLLLFIQWLTDIKRINRQSIIRNVDMKKFFNMLGKKCDQIMIAEIEKQQRENNDNQ